MYSAKAPGFGNYVRPTTPVSTLRPRKLPERVEGEYATADYFATFGVQPVAGRTFTAG